MFYGENNNAVHLEAATRHLVDDPQGRHVPRPPTFAVTAASPSGTGWARSHDRGELLISPEVIVFAPFASTSKVAVTGEFAHTGRSITMTKVRLRSPWSNTFLLLQDKSSYVRIETSGFARRTLRRALRDAGMTLQEAASWHAPPPPAGSRTRSVGPRRRAGDMR